MLHSCIKPRRRTMCSRIHPLVGKGTLDCKLCTYMYCTCCTKKRRYFDESLLIGPRSSQSRGGDRPGAAGNRFSEGNPLELSNHNSRFLHLCQVSNNLMSPGTSKAGDVGYERVQCYIVSSCAVYVYCLKILHIF